MRENLRVSTSCIGFLAGKIQLIKQRAQKEAELAAAISQKWFSYLDNRKKNGIVCLLLSFSCIPFATKTEQETISASYYFLGVPLIFAKGHDCHWGINIA